MALVLIFKKLLRTPRTTDANTRRERESDGFENATRALEDPSTHRERDEVLRKPKGMRLPI